MTEHANWLRSVQFIRYVAQNVVQDVGEDGGKGYCQAFMTQSVSDNQHSCTQPQPVTCPTSSLCCASLLVVCLKPSFSKATVDRHFVTLRLPTITIAHHVQETQGQGEGE